MANDLNIAVIGAGYWGRRVIPEYMQLSNLNPRVKLAKVCDLKGENLDYCAKTLGVEEEKLYLDYEALLSSSDVDAFHICTPNDTHHKFGLAALNAGKHVLIEKPIAMSARDAWELVATAKLRKLILQVGHIYRFSNALKAMRDLMAQGYLGDLYYLKMQWTTLIPSPADRDIVFDLGPHPIDIMNFLLGKWPVRVSCSGRAYRRKSLEEVAYISLEYDDKLLAQIELSWLQPGKVRELNIMGEKRSATVDCLRQTIKIFDNAEGTSYNIDVIPNNTLFDEVSHFALSILESTNHHNPGSVGADNVAVLESLKRSMQEGKTISVGLNT